MSDKSYTVNPLFTADAGGSGSTFKYFTMIAALTAGVQPTQALTTPGAAYFPKNCGEDPTKKANGISKDAAPTLTFTKAFALSSNIFFVGMEDQVFNCNLKTIVQTAQNLGVTSLNNIDPNATPRQTVAHAVISTPRYSFTLGQDSVSPLELTRAYGAVANDGVLCQTRPILSISAVGRQIGPVQASHLRAQDEPVGRPDRAADHDGPDHLRHRRQPDVLELLLQAPVL